MNNEHDSEAYVAHVLSTFETTARKTSKTPSIRERIKMITAMMAERAMAANA